MAEVKRKQVGAVESAAVQMSYAVPADTSIAPVIHATQPQILRPVADGSVQRVVGGATVIDATQPRIVEHVSAVVGSATPLQTKNLPPSPLPAPQPPGPLPSPPILSYVPPGEANAIWTEIPLPSAFSPTCVGAGGEARPLPSAQSGSAVLGWQATAWLVGTGNWLARFDSATWSFQEVSPPPTPSSVARIAVSPRGIVVCTTDNSAGWYGISTSTSVGKVHWTSLPSVGFLPAGNAEGLDIAIGDSQVARIVDSGATRSLYVMSYSGTIHGNDSFQLAKCAGSGLLERVAVGQAQVFGTAAPIWVLRGGAVVRVEAKGSAAETSPESLLDIGVGPANVAFAVGQVQAVIDVPPPAPLIVGHQLWRRSKPKSSWVFASGWGTDVDVDVEGRAWVLRGWPKAKAYVRGARLLGSQTVPAELPIAWQMDPLNPNVAADDTEVTARSNLAMQEGFGGGVGAAVVLYAWSAVDSTGMDDSDLLKPFVDRELRRMRARLQALIDAGCKLLVNIAPIATFKYAVPAHWQSNPLEGFKTFYQKQLLAIAGFREHVAYVSLGNEVDLFFAKYPALLPAFVEMLKPAAEFIRQEMPLAKVGVTTTYDGFANPSVPALTQAVLQNSDVLIFTYYPYVAPPNTYDGLGLPDPSNGATTLQAMRDLANATAKPVAVQELGYASHPGAYKPDKPETWPGLTSAALDHQAAFLEDAMAAWQQAGLAIPFLSWFSLNDYYFNETWTGTFPSVYGDGAGDYGTGNLIAPAFLGDPSQFMIPPPKIPPPPPKGKATWMSPANKAFSLKFASCGLCDANGTPKPAWDVFVKWSNKLRSQGM